MTMSDDQLALALRSSLTDLVSAYDRECESRAYASLFEKLGIPFTVAAACGFLLWPALAVVAGPAGIACAILSSGGAAAYGLWAFSTQSKTVAQSRQWVKVLSEADQEVLSTQTAKLTAAAKAVKGKLLEIEGKKEGPQVGAAATPAQKGPKPSNSADGNTSDGTASGSNSSKGSSPSEAPATATPAAQETKATAPHAALEWRPGEHFVLIGLSGSSKTSTLLECVPENALVVYATLKSEDKAPTDWHSFRLSKFADDAFLRQLDSLCDLVEALVKLAETGVLHRLIIDEALTLLDQAKDAVKATQEKNLKGVADRFEGLIKLYVRTGRSDGHLLGLVTQSPNGTDLFESAKTMQGLRTVLCAGEASSNKFDFLLDWAKQLFGQWLTPADERRLIAIQSGYWHFWMDSGQLQGAPTRLVKREMRDKIEMLTPALAMAALKGIQSGKESQVSPSPPVEEPSSPISGSEPEEEVDWEGRAMELCSVPPGTGLKAAFAMVLGVERKSIQGPKWQQLRNDLRAAMPNFPSQLQQELETRFPNVVLRPGQADED